MRCRENNSMTTHTKNMKGFSTGHRGNTRTTAIFARISYPKNYQNLKAPFEPIAETINHKNKNENHLIIELRVDKLQKQHK